jgi:hypothetical protein
VSIYKDSRLANRDTRHHGRKWFALYCMKQRREPMPFCGCPIRTPTAPDDPGLPVDRPSRTAVGIYVRCDAPLCGVADALGIGPVVKGETVLRKTHYPAEFGGGEHSRAAGGSKPWLA